MKYWVILLLGLSACTNSHVDNRQNQIVNQVEEMKLPIYPTSPEGSMMLNLGVGGKLQIVNGCVGLNYSKENQKFEILLIFPEGTKFVHQGKAIQFFNQADKIFHDGDMVITGGNVPTIERPVHIDIPSHCYGEKYVVAPNMFKQA